MTTNEMALAKAFREAGIEQHKAEGLAQVIFDAIRDNTATKTDLRDTEHRLATDLRDTEQRLTTDLHDVKHQLATVEHRLTADLHNAMHQLTIRGIGALVSGVGILFGLLHQWPPH